MKKITAFLLALFFMSTIAFSQADDDGFKITTIISATKTFTMDSPRLLTYKKMVENEFDERERGSMTFGDSKAKTHFNGL